MKTMQKMPNGDMPMIRMIPIAPRLRSVTSKKTEKTVQIPKKSTAPMTVQTRILRVSAYPCISRTRVEEEDVR